MLSAGYRHHPFGQRGQPITNQPQRPRGLGPCAALASRSPTRRSLARGSRPCFAPLLATVEVSSLPQTDLAEGVRFLALGWIPNVIVSYDGLLAKMLDDVVHEIGWGHVL